ncbi:unnamed protein product [Linum tenue]|uniref:Uncharacterized protein n=1 Tax=Linum tenue TaxID=586396 RepID=A0AAV0NXD0_9ROSI|nr:unnamed protein product [Linum tenue]
MSPKLHSRQIRPPAALFIRRTGGGPSRVTAWRCLSPSTRSSKLLSTLCWQCIRLTMCAHC